jgi:sarcosine oxidase delta subunit
MSFLLSRPQCGVREVTDFGCAGEVTARPRSRPNERELNTLNCFHRNVTGPQREWRYHRSGCRAWCLAHRDTRANEVLWTALPEEATSRSCAPRPDSDAFASARPIASGAPSAAAATLTSSSWRQARLVSELAAAAVSH